MSTPEHHQHVGTVYRALLAIDDTADYILAEGSWELMQVLAEELAGRVRLESREIMQYQTDWEPVLESEG